MAPTQTDEKVYFCGPPWWKCYCIGWYHKRWDNQPPRDGSGKEKPAQPDQSQQGKTSGKEKPAQPDQESYLLVTTRGQQ